MCTFKPLILIFILLHFVWLQIEKMINDVFFSVQLSAEQIESCGQIWSEKSCNHGGNVQVNILYYSFPSNLR